MFQEVILIKIVVYIHIIIIVHRFCPTGMIIGIVIGVLVVIAIIVTVVVLMNNNNNNNDDIKIYLNEDVNVNGERDYVWWNNYLDVNQEQEQKLQ